MTRQKITRLANLRRYRPDPMLTALASYRSKLKSQVYHGNIALISSPPMFQQWIKATWARQLYHGFNQAALQLGYQINYFCAGKTREEKRAVKRVLKARGIGGVLLVPHPFDLTPSDEDYTMLSMVAVFGNSSATVNNVVASHHYGDMTKVLQQLKMRRYRRPGFLLEKQISQVSDYDWLGSFLTHHHGLENNPVNLVHEVEPHDSTDSAAVIKGFKLWLETIQPDVIISSSAWFMHWLKEIGLMPPRDIGFCSLSLSPSTKDKSISGIFQPISSIGYMAVERVVSMLRARQQGQIQNPTATLIGGRWNEGLTLRRTKLIGR